MSDNDAADNLFVPDSETERRFREEIAAIIAKGDLNAKTVIDMGKMPPVYHEIGITDNELKTNAFTVFKGLGLKGDNRHHVSQEILENLLTLVYDPEAVCRSLSGSQNPESYVAVLNAKAEDKPVIAVLSPSRIEKGYTLIPSVYEKNNFENYLKQFAWEGRGLYVKEKDSELWGRLQLPPLHNLKPYTTSILTKEDVVKQILQKNPENRQKAAPFGAGTNNKEARMAEENHVYYVGLLVPDGMKQDAFYDEIYERLFPQHGIYKPEEQKTALEELKTHARNLAFEGSMEAASPFSRDIANLLVKCSGKNLQMQDGRLINPAVYQGEVRQNAPEEQRELTAAERAFTAEIRRRAVIGHALKEGTLCCLPGKDGYADTSPAVNVANGTWYHGATLLQLKEHQKSNGFPSAEYVTQEAVHKSGIPLREGQKGVEISFSVKHEDSGEWEHKAVRLFNVAQTARPWEMKAWAAKQLEEKAQDKEAYLKSQFGDSYKPREASGRKPGPEIVCTSSEPEKYLGQYLAAVSTGGRFKATAEQGAAFKQKFGDALWEKTVTLENGEKRTNPFKLSKICNGANEQCKEVIKEIRGEQKAEQKRQQQQIPNRGRGL